MDMQLAHAAHAARTSSIDMQCGHEAWAAQHEHEAWTCSKDIEHGDAAWTSNTNMQHGDLDMKHVYLKDIFFLVGKISSL
jgi:hypothetical protein